MYVIMLHSVGNEKSTWHWRWLSVSLDHFESLCRYLQQNDYKTFHLDEWYNYFSSNRTKKRMQLVLTFDDGYLDNWVYVYPILKKYGLKGTIFINPEFVDPGESVRTNMEDIWNGRKESQDLQTLGFLNWPEIQAMDASGIVDIQSHSMSHNFYFDSNEIIDVYNGQRDYDWISWFMQPGRKPFSITDDHSQNIPFGYPVFKYGRALGLRRYIPDERLIEKSIELYGNGLQNKEKIIEELKGTIQKFPGHFESNEEIEARYRYEVFDSKIILEEKLNKRVDYLCWPGGGVNELSVKLSIEAGYKATTFGSGEHHGDIGFDKEYKRIPRFGLGSVINTKNGIYFERNGVHLIRLLKSRTGNWPMRVFLKIRKEMIKRFYKLGK